MNILSAFRNWRQRSQTPLWLRQDVRCDENGVSLCSKIAGVPDAGRLNWRSVTTAQVYKRDLFTIDLICLSLSNGSVTLELNEEMPGWKSFLGATEENLQGIVPSSEWWPRVVQPPFHENLQVIYEARMT